MRKAFLCHSSRDKDYVRHIARHLGRARIVFDEVSFAAGQDFVTEIRRGLDESSLLVFVVSRASLDSTWCRFELEEAESRRIAGALQGQLAIITDRGLSFDALPVWLQRSKAIVQPRATEAAREVEQALLALTLPEEARPFVGRQELQRKFAEALAETDRRRLLVVSGLEGIGRRSYLRRACADNLGLRLGPSFLLDETRGLEDMYLWTLDETADLGSREHMASEIQNFRPLPDSEKIGEIVARLQIIARDSIPCLIDGGGMLDELGEYRRAYMELVERFLASAGDTYLALIHRRSPRIQEVPFSREVIYQNVAPLQDHEILLLLQQILRKAGSPAKPESLIPIVEYLDGYAPATYLAATFIERYGVDVLATDKSALIDFKAKRFRKFLTELSLTEDDLALLRYLANERSVPLGGLIVALDLTAMSVATALRRLIDYSLVIASDGNYSLSRPIRESVFRIGGYLEPEFYARVLKRLTLSFWADRRAAPSVELVDATLHAAARSGSSDFRPYQDLIRPSTVHRLAQESYRRREWEAALEYAKRVVVMDPRRQDAEEIAVRALVQLERWDEAAAQLRRLEANGFRRVFYLKGFMLRRQQKHTEALREFEAALAAGDRSVSVYRDYADCLYRCGRYEEALKNIRFALSRDRENIYAIDLLIRICLEWGRRDEAEAALAVLERFDVEERFIHHRRATILSEKRLFEPALLEAEAARRTGVAVFEADATRVDVLIELGRYPEALKAIDEMEGQFRNQRRDVQRGLRCKLLTRQGRWREAKIVWDTLDDHARPVHQGLLATILSAKSQDESVPFEERETAGREAAVIRSRMTPKYSLTAPDRDEENAE